MACFGSPMKYTGTAPSPSRNALRNTSYCTGSVSWNSSTSTAAYSARSAAANASRRSPSSASRIPSRMSSKSGAFRSGRSAFHRSSNPNATSSSRARASALPSTASFPRSGSGRMSGRDSVLPASCVSAFSEKSPACAAAKRPHSDSGASATFRLHQSRAASCICASRTSPGGSASNARPDSNAYRRSARPQNEWIVEIAAWSNSGSARSTASRARRRDSASSGTSAARRAAWLFGSAFPPCSTPCSPPSSFRSRSRSSAVAASVNVTTSSCDTRSPRAISSRA